MLNIDNENQELTCINPAENDSSNDPLLLSGEPFSIKSHWIYKVVGWLGLSFMIVLTAFEVHEKVFNSFAANFNGIMMAMSIFLLVMARSSVHIDEHSITIVRVIGRYRIQWDEIRKIVFDTEMQKVVFYGNEKWLVMPRIVSYVSGRRFGVAEYVNVHVRLRNIHVEFSESTPARSKNTMISLF
jgi:zinc transporter ZupT